MDKKITFIGAALGWGARRSGCEDGPTTLQSSGFTSAIPNSEWSSIVSAPNSARGQEKPLSKTLPLIANFNKRLASYVRHTLRHNKFLIVIGGDHSIAVGTWSGATQTLNAQQKFGLIWVDAHMDAHTPSTRHEGKWGGHFHGQPLACLLGKGEEELTSLVNNNPKLDPKHICLIGIRSYESGERKFLESLGVKIFYIEDVIEQGLDAVFKQAVSIASTDTSGFGLTVDMDAFCPNDAPGVGTPEPNGIIADDFIKVSKGLANNSKLKALEFAEYNPHRDKNSKTAKLIVDIIKSITK